MSCRQLPHRHSEACGACRKKPSPSIDERTVGRAEVLDEVLAVVINDARVPSRDLGFGIVFIQIDVREYAAVRIPAANVRLNADDRKLFADSPAPLDYQPRRARDASRS